MMDNQRANESSLWFKDRYRAFSRLKVKVTGTNLQGDDDSSPQKAKVKSFSQFFGSVFRYVCYLGASITDESTSPLPHPTSTPQKNRACAENYLYNLD